MSWTIPQQQESQTAPVELQERLYEHLRSLRGVETAIEWLNDQDPVAADPDVQRLLGDAADALGYTWEAVPSGAGHEGGKEDSIWDAFCRVEGAVINGDHPGRTSDDQITLFDGTGVGLQDLAVAAKVVQLAQAKGIAQTVEI